MEWALPVVVKDFRQTGAELAERLEHDIRP